MIEISKYEEEVGTYYKPHLEVNCNDRNTTKLREVFNTSSQTTLNKSLNSLQYIGGVIQKNLFQKIDEIP